jgi:hypothetical protein
MTMTTTALRMAFLAAAGAAACAWAPQAAADDTVQADLGGQADVGGGQQWTVTALQPSADVIGYQPAGALWEATATATPAGGGVPVVPGFTARSGGGDSYPVLWTVPTPAGVNPSALPAGTSATGRLYFDVTGPTPDRVAYTRDGQDTAIWVQPPPPAAGAAWPTGTLGYTPPPTAPRTTPGAAALPAQVAPQTPLPAGPAAVPATPPAAASTGTPLSVPPGSAGTPSPAAAGSAGTPLPATGSAGTPATAGQATTPPAAATPAPTPTAPVPAGTPTPTTPSAAPSTVTPAPNSGSSGTPLTAPTTTPVPAAGG